MRHEMREDMRAYLRMRYGDQRRGWGARLRLRLTSRGLFALTLHRLARYCAFRRARGRDLRWLLVRSVLAAGAPLGVWLAKAKILTSCATDGGIWLSDRGYHVIGAGRIGRGSVIHDHVTIGMDVRERHGSVPIIGRDVWIGPNCVIYGNITLGDGATVMPDTVLSKSLPERSVARGNPGRIVRRDYDNARLRAQPVVAETLPEPVGPTAASTD